MKSIKSKISHKFARLAKAYEQIGPTKKTLLHTSLAAGLIALPQLALAQQMNAAAGAGFFCYIAQYFKQIVGTAALVAIFMWALEHIFGASKLHDIVIKVGVAAAIVICGAAMITNSGLTTSCVV